MKQAKKIFTRMCLNNWGGINHKILEFHEYVNLFSGKSGSGKSTVMDAIQVVLYGSFSPSFLNKAADDAKNRRSVLSYLRGEQKDGTANREGQDFCSQIVLELQDTGTKQYVCMGIAFEVRKNDSEIRKFVYFSHLGKIPEGGLYGDSGCVNGPHVHEYLQEMNREVLSKYDLMTVGECAGVTIEEAEKYASADGKELSMVFQFELVDLASGTYGKWTDKRVPLKDFKRVMTAWQTELEGKAWNSLFLGNHDQPRCLSRFGDDSPEYRVVSAKMLATCLHMMQGTPYVYQGDELGMKNVPFHDLSEFRDIESINAFHELTGAGKVAPDDMMRYLNLRGRDNARTPMQWDDTASAGFTTGTPWLKVNPNYTDINAAEQANRPDSIYHWYKELIALRKNPEYKDVVVYGEVVPYKEEQTNLMAYYRKGTDRTLLVIANYQHDAQDVVLPGTYKKVLMNNLETLDLNGDILHMPGYQAVIFEM